MATLTAVQSKQKHKYDSCSCGGVKAKNASTCSKCYHLSRFKNPISSNGKYSHKKGSCIDCGAVISDVYRVYCGSCSHLGERSHNWKGGVTSENRLARGIKEYRLWVNTVFIRDNFTCQKYNIRGGDLVAHHIINFSSSPELRYETSNGITLSKKAHNEFHKIYGRNNNTIEQLSEFLINKTI
jgi:5-methylcytosine-specific restriction endonuclease McrA